MSTSNNSRSPVQLGLGIEPSKEPKLEDAVLEHSPHLNSPDEESLERTQGFSINAFIVAGFFLLATGLLVNLSEERTSQTASIPENFLVEDLSPALPLERNLPDFEFPDHGEVLQVGIFARLEGAESQQTELTGLGLAPHIEKRITNNSVRYAVVLGPLDDVDHESAVKMLEENKLQYFHRQKRDS